MDLTKSKESHELSFGDIIRQQRIAQNLNRTQLANLINIDHQVLWGIENSNRLPFKETGKIREIANALQIEPEVLMEKAFAERLERKKVSDYVKIDTDDLSDMKKKTISMLKMVINSLTEVQAAKLLENLFEMHKQNLEESKNETT